MEQGIWAWIRRNTLERAIRALGERAQIHHSLAKVEPDRHEKERLRQDADGDEQAKKELWHVRHQGTFVSDHSVSGNSAPVQQTHVTAPTIKSTRDLLYAAVIALSLITNLVLWSKLHDADKDIQTQVWLRDDALTKFEQGPYADLKAHVLALEINCKR